MAEDRPLNITGTSCTSSAAPSQIGALISSGHEENTAEQDFKQQQKPVKNNRSSFKASEDDDVQIIFSAPRRRRKRRHRSASLCSSITPSQEFQQSGKRPSAARAMDANSSATDLGATAASSEANSAENNASEQCDSLPANGSSHVTGQRHQWLSNANYGSNRPLPFTSFPSSIPWWNDPVQPNNRQSFRWNPLGIGDGVSKKRKHEEEFNPRPNHVQYRQSPQISPRSIPTPLFAPLGHTFSGMEFGPLEPSGRIDHNSMSASSWPNFNWNAFDVGTFQYGSQNSPNSNLRSEIVSSPRVWTNNPQNLPAIYRQPEKQLNVWAQPLERTSPSCEPKKQSPIPNQASHQQSQVQTQDTAQDVSSQPLVTLPTPQQTSSLQAVTTPQGNLNLARAPQISHLQEESQPQLPLLALNGSTGPPNAQLADILRKPSLYSIPAWPNSPSQTATPTIIRESPNQNAPLTDKRANGAADAGASSRPSIGGFNQIQHSNLAVQASSPSKSTIATKISMSSPAYPQAQIPRPADVDTFQVPGSRAGRKHSPNLIVDIAETSQEVFPFSALAARHGVPVQKVFDTFSAIIQLPLLRNADDRRRHGELGKRRMRDYREAKKAMEKAQEAERKDRLRKIREERAERERKRIEKEEKDTEELSRKAALNKARESQAPGFGFGSAL